MISEIDKEIIHEAALIALCDADIFDNLVEEMDVKPEYLSALRDNLEKELNNKYKV